MQKQKVSRACDTCKRRKIRCTGKLPCAHCVKNNKSCEFKAVYTRGAVPEIQSAPVEEQEKYLEEVGYKRRQIWRRSSTTRKSGHVLPPEGPQDKRDEAERAEDLDPSIETNSSDTQHNQGSVYQKLTDSNSLAGTCLYERTQSDQSRPSSNQKNPVYAYGDPPLPEIDTSFLILPSEKTAHALVEKYFDFVVVTNRFVHRPTIDIWTSQLLGNAQNNRPTAEDNGQRAVVLMVFASSHAYINEGRENDHDTSFYYFQAADNLLAKETGEIRLATLQARLLQCLYLLSRSRVNQCYSVFGTVVSYIYALGLQRAGRPSQTKDLLEVEMRKRVFWSAYLVDKYTSSALGRPQRFHDEDIDQPLPINVEDDKLSSTSLETMSSDAQTPMKGGLFQIKLAQIISRVLRELYGVQKNSLETRFSSVERLHDDLQRWRSEVAHFIDLEPSLLSPLYGRQNITLRLSYLQALIILYRPFLVDSFNTYLEVDLSMFREKVEDKINRCLEAALDSVKIIDALYKVETCFDASWFSHFCGYAATVALFVHIIKRCTLGQTFATLQNAGENFRSLKLYFDSATRCQEQIKNSSTTKESFAQKCSIVLEELRAEAAVKIRHLQSKDPNTWSRNEQREHTEAEQISQGSSNGGSQNLMEDPEFFGAEWNDLDFKDQSTARGDGIYSITNGLDGYHEQRGSGSLVDRIDMWGFSDFMRY